jgi:hypothetical protein
MTVELEILLFVLTMVAAYFFAFCSKKDIADSVLKRQNKFIQSKIRIHN